MDRKKSGPLALITLVGFGLVGCVGEPESARPGAGIPRALDAGRVRIENDLQALSARVEHMSIPLTVGPKSPTGAQVADKPSERLLGVRLTQVASIESPVVDGQRVQANDIDIRDHIALVTFNVGGDPFKGAVQVIDFGRPDHPDLVSEVQYSDADANAVVMLGSQVFIGLASDDPALSSPAVVQELKFTSGIGLESTTNWLDLPSWAVTDLALNGDVLVAGVGAQDGGLVTMQRSGLAMLHFAPAYDVRGVAFGDGNHVMSVCGGAPAHVMSNDATTLAQEASVAATGYSQEYAKGTIEWAGGYCYLGAGDGGFQVRSSTGELEAQLSNSDLAASAGTADCVVNAASVAKDLAFLAAGSGGLQVVGLHRFRSDGLAAGDADGLELLGTLSLENGSSSNMVRAGNGILVVAAGLGGVKIVQMEFIR